MKYTNGAYTVEGQLVKSNFYKESRIVGVIIETKYPSNYNIGQYVNFPLYHNTSDLKPQFKCCLSEKINYLLKSLK